MDFGPYFVSSNAYLSGAWMVKHGWEGLLNSSFL